MPRLDDVPFFLALARHKRLSTAARRLEVSHSMIGRRVAALAAFVTRQRPQWTGR
jgi:DNA-binding transcriptional LysR family regulator